ncbi:MAG: hypothetical protein WCW44_04875 [archaeon]|jgi:hypothetical protein
MATYYVNKSGSDSNNGTTAALAKLTIQAGANLLTTTGDALVIGSGTYNEKITIPSTFNGTIYFDGTVILDGTSLASGNAITINIAGTQTKSFAPYSTGGKLIIKNHIGSYLLYLNTPVLTTLSVQGVEFYSNGQTAAIYNTVYTAPTIIQNCLFSGFSGANYAIYLSANNSTVINTVVNNTFYNCGYALYQTFANQAAFPIVFMNNIVSNCTYAFRTGTSNANLASAIIIKNHYYSITSGWITGGGTYATLAAWQAVGFDASSISANPNFADPANEIFYLTTASSISSTQGAIPFGYARGQAYDPQSNWNIIPDAGHDNSGWYNPDGNVGKNGTTGFFELIGGTAGVIWSPVYDFGSVQAIKQINLAVDQTWGTTMVDTTTSDTKPNYQTIEVRGSGTSFNQDDGTIAWTEVKLEMPITPVSGRFIQVRLTLRTDDVSA